MAEFTHITDGHAQMVTISEKAEVYREATASGTITLRRETIEAIKNGTVVKGNVLATARVAATLAVKDTPRTIPMCHTIPIHGIDINFDVQQTTITGTVTVKSAGKTGVEMEALVGVSTALLTIWDMVKSAEKDADGQYPVTAISEIRVIKKVKRPLKSGEVQ